MAGGDEAKIDYASPPRSRVSKHKSRHVAQLSNVPWFGRSRLAARIQKAAADGPQDRRLPNLMAFLELSKWVGPYLKDVFRKRARYREYPAAESGIFAAGDGPVRIAMVADWGTGTLESETVAEQMKAGRPHFTVHLGDVYHLGDPQEIAENCLGKATKNYGGVKWPKGSRGSFALMGNHEMYSGGQGFYERFLPELGLLNAKGELKQAQRAGFFCLEAEHWILLGLDTGYHSGGMPLLGMLPGVRSIEALNVDAHFDPKMLAWLQRTMAAVQPATGTRKAVVVLSHHQPLSAFEPFFAEPAKQMAKMGMLQGQEFVWLYGHEHRLTVYKKQTVGPGLVAYPRCIGHGGMPVSVSKLTRPDKRVLYYDPRVHAIDVDHPKTMVGFNGHALLTIQGKRLGIEYRDILGNRVLWSETFVADEGGKLTHEAGAVAPDGWRRGTAG